MKIREQMAGPDLQNLFDPKKVKKWPQKLLIIGPDPFISQSSPGTQPRIDFSYYEISGPDKDWGPKKVTI